MNLPLQQPIKSKPKIAVVVTTPLIIRFFLYKHIEAMTKRYSVIVLTTSEQADLLNILPEEVKFYPIPIKRKISLGSDVKTLFKLIQIFRKEKYVLVHSVTPKAGLLSMFAAKLTSVPFRIHTFTGQVWVTRHGVSRFLLKSLDKTIAFNATRVLVDSNSQREFLIKQHIVSKEKSSVLADGSICGVDLTRFHINAKKRISVRKELSISESSVLIIYVGRLTRDKGVFDLVNAFSLLHKQFPETKLLVVGPDEEGIQSQLYNVLQDCIESVRFVPYTTEPEHYMQAADIFCLPSYREGFGSSIIEAAAWGLPAIASRIYGLTDAVKEEETGLLVNPGDVTGLANAIIELVKDGELRKSFGEAAYQRARRDFSQERITRELLTLYSDLLNND